jgi:hypothetical protein
VHVVVVVGRTAGRLALDLVVAFVVAGAVSIVVDVAFVLLVLLHDNFLSLVIELVVETVRRRARVAAGIVRLFVGGRSLGRRGNFVRIFGRLH